MVQPLNETDFFFKGRNRKTGCINRETSWIAQLLLTGPPPLGECQLAYFIQIKVDAVMKSIGTGPAGKPVCDIGEIIEMQIVKYDQLAVARRDDILLEVVSAHGMGHSLAGQRVLRPIGRCAAMRDDQRSDSVGALPHRSAHYR